MRSKMKNEKFDLDKTNEKIESCGVNANTKRCQQLAEKTFLDFVKSRIGDHEVIFTDAQSHQNNFQEIYVEVQPTSMVFRKQDWQK